MSTHLPAGRPGHRHGAAAVLTAATLAAAAACSSSSGSKATATAQPVTAATAAATATTATAGNVKAACDTELAINALDFPGIDPDAPRPSAEQLRAFAAKAEPLATTLRASVPAELTSKVDILASVVNGAKQGKPIDYDGSGLNAAGQAVDGWMVGHCGYPKLTATLSGGKLTGLPATAPAGPVAITFINTGDPAKAGFVLLFGKVKNGQTATAAGVANGTTDLDKTTDIVTAAQPRAGKPGYTIAKLPAGHYIVASPLGTPPTFAGGITATELDLR